MQLIRIKLSGFKSFVDQTIIDFKSNLNAIVGPNGCGKSNIIDCIKWVLGESHAKQLRADSLNEVIFSGSKSRKGVSRASVELIFDNRLKVADNLWTMYDEISIKRILVKNQESEYFINNQNVKRKDILDLFFGLGVNKGGYAIIEQGTITSIIQAKPEDLMAYLEEGAKLSKYKHIKNETCTKLSQVEVYIERLNDIFKEKKSVIDTLESQVAVLQDYKRLTNELNEIEYILLNEKIVKFQKQANEYIQVLQTLENNKQNILLELEKLQFKLAELTNLRKDLNEKYLKNNQEFNNLRVTISQSEEKQKLYTTLSLKAQKNLEQLENNIENLQNNLLKITNDLSLQEQNLHIEQKKIHQLDKKFDQLKITFVANDSIYNELVIKISQLENIIQTTNNDINLIKNSITLKQQFQTSLKNSYQNNVKKLENFTFDVDSIKVVQVQLDQSKKNRLTIEQKISLINQENLINQNTLNTYQQQMSELLHYKTSLLTKISLLEDIINQHAVKSKINNQFKEQDQHGTLYDNIEVHTGYENVFEIALGDILFAYSLKSYTKIIDYQLKNGAYCLEESSNKYFIDNQFQSMSLVQYLKIKNSAFNSINKLLSNYLVTDNLESAIKLIQQVPDNFLIITQDGHLISKYYVRLNVNQKKFQILKNTNQIIALKKELHLLADKINILDTQIQEILNLIKNNSDHMSVLQKSFDDAIKNIHHLEMQILTLNEQEQKNKYLYQTITAEQNKISNSLKDLELELQEMNNQLNINIKTIGVQKLELEIFQKSFKEKTIQRQDLEMRLSAIENNRKKMLNASTEFTNQILILKNQKNYCEQEITRIFNEINCINAEKKEYLNYEDNVTLDKLRQVQTENAHELLQQQKELQHLDGLISEFNLQIKTINQQITTIDTKINAANLENEKVQINLNFYSKQMQEKFKDYTSDVNSLEIQLNSDIKFLENKKNIIEQDIAALGLINLKAQNEYDQQIKEFHQLKFQMDDSQKASLSLKEAIKHIDDETRSLLNQYFQKVNENFAAYFAMLFNGGHAYIKLTNNDILNAGINIIIQPNGKKHCLLHQLSGGEKALTAISFIFALFSVNKSPICILDEVDAPLDDVNTVRFCKLMQKLAIDTQFIFISHNPVALELADHLIGITMQEDGVSSVVAVSVSEIMSQSNLNLKPLNFI